jgi:hypothetical protein
MPRRVFDGDRSTLGDAEKHESRPAGGVDDRLQVSHPGVDRQLADPRVRQPTAAFVVAEHRVRLAESVEPMAPDRAGPIKLEVREPGPDPHQRRAATVDLVRETRAIGRAANRTSATDR